MAFQFPTMPRPKFSNHYTIYIYLSSDKPKLLYRFLVGFDDEDLEKTLIHTLIEKHVKRMAWMQKMSGLIEIVKCLHKEGIVDPNALV